MARLCTLLGPFLLAGAIVPQPTLAAPPAQTQANVVSELSFTASRDHDDPFNKISLDVQVTAPDGAQQRVPAYWAGGKTWKFRYASPIVGKHRYQSECSARDDVGLHGVRGEIEIKPYAGTNRLYAHGPIRVAPNRRHFEHADGTPFFWLGDTWWMGLCHRLHWPGEVKTLAADRKAKGFNVIQIVAGLYPDMPPFDPRGANEAGFPWEPDYARIRPEYFDAADERLQFLVDEGFTPCIVGAWGYFMPWMGVEKSKQHWRYLIARYGAMPVVWCAAGEANLPWYLAKGFPYDDRKQVADWTEVLRYIRATDPFHRPLTIHPTGIGRLSARNCTNDPALLDFDMLQTPHGQRNAVEPTVRTMRESYADMPIMPVINGEAAYEMLSDSLPTKWTRQMFWLCMTNGAAGHTYGANGIWQCNRRGRPHGPSPHGGDYGHISWDESMNLPGSEQVGFGKKLFERFEWQKFQPHAEWAENVENDSAQTISWSNWIWYPEAEPANDVPAAKRYFRQRFNVAKTRTNESIARATLAITADDKFIAYLNGQQIAEGTAWQSPRTIDVTKALRPGNNLLAIEAENLPAPTANPAGLLASLRIQNARGNHEDKLLPTSWRCSNDVGDASNWMSPDFEDANWALAKELGPYGMNPWGRFETSARYGPYATGIPSKVRIIYIPDSQVVQVLNIERAADYGAEAFNPVSGATKDLGHVVADDSGKWSASKPADFTDADDWVLILSAARQTNNQRRHISSGNRNDNE